MMHQPAHKQRCHTHVKYIKLLRNSTEIKKDKKLLDPCEADGVLQYQRTTVSVFLYLCLHLISARKKNARRKKKAGGWLRGSAFPLNPKKRDYQSHNNMDASQKPCQLSELSYISDRFFPPRFFFNLSLP